jgi:hypothetical protein
LSATVSDIQSKPVAGFARKLTAARTLLTTGAVEAVMHTWKNKGQRIETPHLAIRYQPKEWSRFRENGKTWSIITKDSRQPTGFEPRTFNELSEDRSDGNNS